MIRRKRVLCLALATASLFIFALSCSSPPTAKPPVAAAPTTQTPKIIGISGIRELKPTQESALICVTEGPADETLTYIWSAEKGAIKGQGKQVTWVAPDAPGDYAVSVTVSNLKNETATFTRTFKVTTNPFNNDTPDTTIYLRLSLQSGNVVSEARHPKAWTTSEIECVVADEDPSTLRYEWTAPTGKLAGNGLAEGKAIRVGWISPGVPGLYKVAVAVTDKSGKVAHGEVNFDVYCCKE